MRVPIVRQMVDVNDLAIFDQAAPLQAFDTKTCTLEFCMWLHSNYDELIQELKRGKTIA